MRYRLVYTHRAEKDIKKLDVAVKHRIGKTLLKYSGTPFKYAESLTDLKLGTHRFRIGDYRVVFDVESKDVVILRVGHRKEIYRR